MRNFMNYAGRICLLLGFMSAVSVQVSGQVADSSFGKEFNAFKGQINQEYSSFISQNDSIFILFLQTSWKEFSGKPNPAPVIPKPVDQPVYPLSEEKWNHSDSIVPEIQRDSGIAPAEERAFPEKDAMETRSPGNSFSFYGNMIALPTTGHKVPELTAATREGIMDYFIKAGRSAIIFEIAENLKEKSDRYKLNDWGFASLLFQAAKSYSNGINEQVLFTWAGLLHTGYNVKVGYNNRRIYLLIPANVQLYTASYTIGNREYYILDPGSDMPKSDKLFIHEANYPGNKSDFSFLLTEIPQFGNQEINRILLYEAPLTIHLNKNLLDFYRNYPPCELAVYFNTPISGSALQQLDAFFLPRIKEKNDSERVAYLLAYVQQTIRYKTDREQFGKERYLFPDETLFFPAADCEDRSVLFARLLNRYTRLGVIGLCYPSHVTLAVELPPGTGEDFVVFNNKRFYHCDPTYLGADCGMAMPSVKITRPEIINYMQL